MFLNISLIIWRISSGSRGELLAKFERCPRRLDNVVSTQMPQEIRFKKPATATDLLNADAHNTKCMGFEAWGAPGDVWPCRSADPASPPHANHQMALRKECLDAKGCTVRDFKELYGDAPTWHQVFADGNPQVYEKFATNGLLKKRSKHL